ncbi:MAG: hypothetical protein VKJ04_05790 [Vampirovibrionales bacterium]|nr:hypothetical protein [Vampirovibrionales bacterium]
MIKAPFFVGNFSSAAQSPFLQASVRPSLPEQLTTAEDSFTYRSSALSFGAAKKTTPKKKPVKKSTEPPPRPGSNISDSDPPFQRELAAYRRVRRDPNAEFSPQDAATIKDRIAGGKTKDQY